MLGSQSNLGAKVTFRKVIGNFLFLLALATILITLSLMDSNTLKKNILQPRAMYQVLIKSKWVVIQTHKYFYTKIHDATGSCLYLQRIAQMNELQKGTG